jgi:hypothetical protein
MAHNSAAKRDLKFMDKAVPKSKKFANVQGKLDTGLTVNKVKSVSSSQYAQRRDEIFFRISRHQVGVCVCVCMCMCIYIALCYTMLCYIKQTTITTFTTTHNLTNPNYPPPHPSPRPQVFELYSEYEADEYEDIAEAESRHAGHRGPIVVTHTEAARDENEKPYLLLGSYIMYHFIVLYYAKPLIQANTIYYYYYYYYCYARCARGARLQRLPHAAGTTLLPPLLLPLLLLLLQHYYY